MSSSNFTEGKWSIGEQNGHCGISIKNNNNGNIATVYLGLVTSRVKRGDEHYALPENKESLSNANLIAAAPEMYNLLELIVELDKLSPHQNDIINKLLAKVRGEHV